MSDPITTALIQELQAQCPDINVPDMANRILRDPRVHSPAKCLRHTATTAQALKLLTRQTVINLSQTGKIDTPPTPPAPDPPTRSLKGILESAPWYAEASSAEAQSIQKLRAHEHAQRVQYREQDKAGEI